MVSVAVHESRAQEKQQRREGGQLPCAELVLLMQRAARNCPEAVSATYTFDIFPCDGSLRARRAAPRHVCLFLVVTSFWTPKKQQREGPIVSVALIGAPSRARRRWRPYFAGVHRWSRKPHRRARRAWRRWSGAAPAPSQAQMGKFPHLGWLLATGRIEPTEGAGALDRTQRSSAYARRCIGQL